MPETSRERQGKLVRGVIEILAGEPEGLPAKEVLRRLEAVVPPTEFEDSFYPSTAVRRREKAVRFATIPFVKAGWLRKENGIWRVTPDGLAAAARFVDDGDLAREAVRLYREWKSTQAPDPDDFADADEPDEVPETTSILEEAEESAWTEIREYLMAMNPYDFQDLVGALLKAMGYHIAYVSPPGPDDGIDVVAFTDPLGASGPRIKVQVKRRADRADVDAIRSFMALLGTQDIGLFVNAGGFTSNAAREARSQENRRVTLIDVDRLFALWVEHYDNVAEVDRNRLPLRSVYFLDPRE